MPMTPAPPDMEVTTPITKPKIVISAISNGYIAVLNRLNTIIIGAVVAWKKCPYKKDNRTY